MEALIEILVSIFHVTRLTAMLIIELVKAIIGLVMAVFEFLLGLLFTGLLSRSPSPEEGKEENTEEAHTDRNASNPPPQRDNRHE